MAGVAGTQHCSPSAILSNTPAFSGVFSRNPDGKTLTEHGSLTAGASPERGGRPSVCRGPLPALGTQSMCALGFRAGPHSPFCPDGASGSRRGPTPGRVVRGLGQHLGGWRDTPALRLCPVSDRDTRPSLRLALYTYVVSLSAPFTWDLPSPSVRVLATIYLSEGDVDVFAASLRGKPSSGRWDPRDPADASHVEMDIVGANSIGNFPSWLFRAETSADEGTGTLGRLPSFFSFLSFLCTRLR